jgi:hypothetical protein
VLVLASVLASVLLSLELLELEPQAARDSTIARASRSAVSFFIEFPP